MVYISSRPMLSHVTWLHLEQEKRPKRTEKQPRNAIRKSYAGRTRNWTSTKAVGLLSVVKIHVSLSPLVWWVWTFTNTKSIESMKQPIWNLHRKTAKIDENLVYLKILLNTQFCWRHQGQAELTHQQMLLLAWGQFPSHQNEMRWLVSLTTTGGIGNIAQRE